MKIVYYAPYCRCGAVGGTAHTTLCMLVFTSRYLRDVPYLYTAKFDWLWFGEDHVRRHWALSPLLHWVRRQRF